MPSVEAHHRVNGADTGRYSGGRQIKKCPGPHLYINIYFFETSNVLPKKYKSLVVTVGKIHEG